MISAIANALPPPSGEKLQKPWVSDDIRRMSTVTPASRSTDVLLALTDPHGNRRMVYPYDLDKLLAEARTVVANLASRGVGSMPLALSEVATSRSANRFPALRPRAEAMPQAGYR